MHAEKSFRNIIKSTRNRIVFTIFRLISNQTDIRLVPNQSENGKYNLISGWFNKISKIFLRVCHRLGVQTGKTRIHCLESLGIMGAQSRAPLKPHNTIAFWWSVRFQGASIWPPTIPIDARLSDERSINTS